MKKLMGSNERSPESYRSNPASLERIGGGSPEILNRKLNYFTNKSQNNVPLYTDGKGYQIARLDHTLEEAKKHEFSEFLLDKPFNDSEIIIK